MKKELFVIKLYAVYGDMSPSMTTVRYRFNEFKRGRTSVFDEERPGRPADVVTEEIIEKVHDVILADRRTKVREVGSKGRRCLDRNSNSYFT